MSFRCRTCSRARTNRPCTGERPCKGVMRLQVAGSLGTPSGTRRAAQLVPREREQRSAFLLCVLSSFAQDFLQISLLFERLRYSRDR